MPQQTNDRNRIRVLLVGLHGLTASAFAAGVTAMASGALPKRYGVTGHILFANANLPEYEDLTIGGWDVSRGSVQSTLTASRHVPDSVIDAAADARIITLPGISTSLDFPAAADRNISRRPRTIREGAEWVAQDIDSGFGEASGARTIVIYVGSPSRRPEGVFARQSLAGDADNYPSALIYALGAIQAGADFVDFTPGYALEYGELWDRAIDGGAQLAGRDGSTGQTMLKETLAELFDRRGIELTSWYSTNVLGNHDGWVLTRPGYGDAKIADKTNALLLDARDHAVDISYVPGWGDRKESWDAAEATTWLGQTLSMRVNWRASDSELAGAMLMDLVRIISKIDRVPGFRPELGFFFKRPFLREGNLISERWAELVGLVDGRDARNG